MMTRPAPGSVRHALEGQSRFERGSPDLVDNGRVAVVAHWSRLPALTRSVNSLVHQLQRHGYRVVLVSSCESTGELVFGDDVDVARLTVIRKPNIGYDFGSWSVALHMCPAACTANRTLLVNDSMAGPFADLGVVLKGFDASPVDVWGVTDTQQFGHHLQSYFMGFRDGVLAERPLARFWAGIRHHADKQQIIMQNELGLSRLLRAEGFVFAPQFPHEGIVPSGQNPTIIGWRRLLELGFPMVKREILRNPAVAPAGRSVSKVLRARYDQDVADWVDDAVSA